LCDENKENIFVDSSWWTHKDYSNNSIFSKTTIPCSLRHDLSSTENALNQRSSEHSTDSTNNNTKEYTHEKRNDNEPLKLMLRSMTTWLEDELHHKTASKVTQSSSQEDVCFAEDDFQDLTVELGFLDDSNFGSEASKNPSSSNNSTQNDTVVTQWPSWLEDKSNTLSHLDNQIWIQNFSFDDGIFPNVEKDIPQQPNMQLSDGETISTENFSSVDADNEVKEGDYLQFEGLPNLDIQINLPDASIQDSDTDSDVESDSTDEECEMDTSRDDLDSSMDLDDLSYADWKVAKRKKKNQKIKQHLLALSKSKMREVIRDSKNRRRALPLIQRIAHQRIQNTLLAIPDQELHLLQF